MILVENDDAGPPRATHDLRDRRNPLRGTKIGDLFGRHMEIGRLHGIEGGGAGHARHDLRPLIEDVRILDIGCGCDAEMRKKAERSIEIAAMHRILDRLVVGVLEALLLHLRRRANRNG
ncbi:hypothetical protein [Sphingomonas sp. 66-10]|uniref:hypothetical protein n=1 Tax=Sphingomonas sp. 66-10 TaxID=1895848 RepID=UPI00257EDC0A|nr:hypothetical protein [Sphingomonas sp. 66-10]